MITIAEKIMQRVTGHANGTWVCTPKDFLDLGNRRAIDQALSRLTKTGRLRRLGHGLYVLPRFSSVLNRPAPVNLDSVIAALARRDGARIMSDGMIAANQLGLTDLVPAKVSYVTDGHSRTVNVDGRTIHLRHASPSVMKWAGRRSGPVVQALRWLGPSTAANGKVIATLSRILPDDVKLDLLNNCRDLPGWAVPLVREVAGDQPATA